METINQIEAAQFRVALLLKQYKFGASSAAKYLGRSRGLVQSWMQNGKKHYLAKENIKLKSFEKIIKKLRLRITKEHLEYFMVKRLLDLKLPVAFISKIMELPTSTVRSWRFGKVPHEIKKFFYDPRLVNREFNKLLKFLKSEITRNNLEYFLAMRLANTTNENSNQRRLGGRIISHILRNHFDHINSIPEKTISCWINRKRRPWDSFDVLADEIIIRREYNKIVDELTYKYLTYHMSKLLAEKYNWKYRKISNVLGINKEQVRGWIKKGRGNPVAKTFVNSEIVDQNLDKYLNETDKLDITSEQINVKTVSKKKTITREKKSKSSSKMDKIKKNKERSKPSTINKELEQELIYHLETIPTGVTSPKILKSILINHRGVSIDEIERTLENSKQIIQNNGKWMLKKLLIENEE